MSDMMRALDALGGLDNAQLNYILGVLCCSHPEAVLEAVEAMHRDSNASPALERVRRLESVVSGERP